MHEYSIVQALLNQCEDIVFKNNATKVKKVIVKIGVLSGVEIDLFKTAFDTFKEKTICEDATLKIINQKIVIKCQKCQEESTLEENQFCCPKCESIEVEVLDGEDMYLMQLELE